MCNTCYTGCYTQSSTPYHQVACGLQPGLPRDKATGRALSAQVLRLPRLQRDSKARLESYLKTFPLQPDLRQITSLSLTPFERDINDLRACYWIRELFCHTCDTLKKLVIDIPLRTCLPQQDLLGVRPVLREAFEKLVNLEEFIAVKDELPLDLYHGERAFVWRCWPKLKRMALGGASCDSTFWQQVALHPSLSTLVVREPDEMPTCDPKSEHLRHTDRPLRFVILTTPSWRVEGVDYYWVCDWITLDPTDNMSISEYLLPYCLEKDGSMRNAARRRQEFIRNAAEDGSLWNWQGKQILHTLQSALSL